MARGFDVTGAEGLRDLVRDLGRIDPALKKEIQKMNKAVAKTVADKAVTKYEQVFTWRTGRGSASIRALASQTRAQIAFGSARAPYLVGQEFGSIQYPQFGPRSGGGPTKTRLGKDWGSAGRFVFPTIREEATGLPDLYADSLDSIMAKVGFKGAGG